jgi:hypothetical protein
LADEGGDAPELAREFLLKLCQIGRARASLLRGPKRDEELNEKHRRDSHALRLSAEEMIDGAFGFLDGRLVDLALFSGLRGRVKA